MPKKTPSVSSWDEFGMNNLKSPIVETPCVSSERFIDLMDVIDIGTYL